MKIKTNEKRILLMEKLLALTAMNVEKICVRLGSMLVSEKNDSLIKTMKEQKEALDNLINFEKEE